MNFSLGKLAYEKGKKRWKNVLSVPRLSSQPQGSLNPNPETQPRYGNTIHRTKDNRLSQRRERYSLDPKEAGVITLGEPRLEVRQLVGAAS